MILVINRKKRAVLYLAAALLLTAAILSVFWPTVILDVTGKPGRLVPIYYVDTEEKKIAISFDASWDDGNIKHNY